jgi:RHS repeat-associated protein
LREDGSYTLYEYDAAVRLSKEIFYNPTGEIVQSISYSYDLDGKRTRKVDNFGTQNYSYNANGQLASVDLNQYSYDADGRLQQLTKDGETVSLSHDNLDRLTQVNINGTTTQYLYDGNGNRIGEVSGNNTKNYLVAPNLGNGLSSMDLVTDESGNIVSDYVYGGSNIIARLDENGEPIYYLTDSMGSVIGLVDSQGNVLSRIVYDGFGQVKSGDDGSSLGGDFRFQGQWLESESGLYYMRARDYDAETGLFLSRDPVDVQEQSVEAFNPYQFAFNNPLVYSDPTGEFTLNEIQISNQIQNILNTIRYEATTQIKQELYNQAKGIVGNILQGFLNKYLPPYNFFNDYTKILKDPQGGGDVLEDLVKDAVCALLKGNSAINNIYLGPDITEQGKAIRDGKNCQGQFLSPNIAKPKGVPDPDFVISKPKPTDAYQAQERSWLVGDFKLSVSLVKDSVDPNKPDAKKQKQWKAIKNYALKSQYIPLANYVTFYSPKQQVYIKNIEAKALTNFGVKLFIIPLTTIEK